MRTDPSTLAMPPRHGRRLRVLTWHVHGNYLYYLTRAPHDFYVPVDRSPNGPRPGCAPLGNALPWGNHVHEVPIEQVREHAFDVVIYQSHINWQVDRHELLSVEQRALPTICIEHDPPRQSPTDTVHPIQDRNVLLVHVTPFNALMWDSGITPTRVIEHGVIVPDDARYGGERAQGIVVVNNLVKRGRRLGLDVYTHVREHVPLVLVGMDSTSAPGGIGEIANASLPAAVGQYRFFFNPIRWTSLGLAIVEAMMVGVPVVGLATTELVTVIDNDVSGWVDTDVDRLIDVMHRLLDEPMLARQWGEAARAKALERFGIERFIVDWNSALSTVCG
ncbi:MAG TPA: glycosyltransferase [Burkholderiaceae bacterium]|nr:glycosyltransferase [Burkholderiaceae bacterium]